MTRITELTSRPPGISDDVYLHPLALVESSDIGVRTKVWPFAHIMSGAKIGQDCNICEQVYIESGVVVGNSVTVKNGVALWDKVVVEDEVFIGPNAVFTNHPQPRAFVRGHPEAWLATTVKKGATVGAGAIIICGVTLGSYCFIGAGAVVTKSVAPFLLVVGNPARAKNFICKCLQTKFEIQRRGELMEPVGKPCGNCGIGPAEILSFSA